MAYINEEEILKIRQEADIVDIISAYLPLQQKGRNYVALCPFHDDHSPSMVVSKERQIFNCFTCRTGGNVFSFIMKFKNVGFLEAVEMVAQKIGYNLKVEHKTENPVLQKEYLMYDLATKFYQNNLNTAAGSEAKKYLHNRGITDDIIKEFKIGLALKDKDKLSKLLMQKKYSLEEIEKLGLVNKSGIDITDTFANRIMIPITNFNGQVVAFTGRIYNEENTAKYINSRETSIFKKSHILFNYHNAKKMIREANEVIVVEGNMDAIMLSSKGLKNVVALMGVALSNEQINELKKMRVPVVLMLDNDNAGLEATKELGQKLIDAQIPTKVVRLTGAKDPDEYIRAFGMEALKENIAQASSYIDFKLNYLQENKNLQTIPDVVKYVKEVLASIGNVDDLTKDMVISNLSTKYNLDKELLKANLKNAGSEPVSHQPVRDKKISKSKYERATDYILYAMMLDSKYIRIYKERLGYLKNKIERIIFSQIVYYNNSYNDINIADFTSFIQDNEEINAKVMDIIAENQVNEVNMTEFNKCIDVIHAELKKEEIKKLKTMLQNELDVNKKVEILAKIAEMKKEVEK